MRQWVIAAAAAALTGCATAPATPPEPLTPERFASLVVIEDDSLDTTATLHTRDGFRARRSFGAPEFHDSFLRAFVDKKTGATSYQLYEVVEYGGDWRFYTRANYATPDGPRTAAATGISRDVLGCSASRYSAGCSLSEHLGVTLDEPTLRAIAAGYDSGAYVWEYKFTAQNGMELFDTMPAAEVAGLLLAVERYRQSRGLGQ